MTGAGRVHQLTLRAARREQVPRALRLIEDAFHTMTLPRLGPGCVLVVRRLDLGEISIARPSQHIARRLSERLRELGLRALPHDHPAAEHADAVYWPDCSAARAALVTRLVAGPTPREWFWRALSPVIHASAPRERALIELLLPTAPTSPREPPALVLAALTLRKLAERHVASAALVQLPAAVVKTQLERTAPAALLPLCAAELEPAPRHAERLRVHTVWRALLEWSLASFPQNDPRPAWIACCALVTERPELASAPQLGKWVQRLLKASRAERQFVRSDASSAAAVRARELLPWRASHALDSSAAPAQQPLEHTAAGKQITPPAAASGGGPSPRYPVEGPAAAPPELNPHQVRLRVPALCSPARSDFAGLLFLLPVLTRLELERVLLSEPALLDQMFGLCILSAVLDRCGAEALEPMRRALAPAREPSALQVQPFVAPSSWWTDTQLSVHTVPGAGHLVRAEDERLWLAYTQDDPRCELSELLAARSLHQGADVARDALPSVRIDAWLAAAARVLRRRARLDLQSLICRRGIVAAGPTHIDVALPSSELDMRVRSAALDVNPGWVAYLGRVITFHYLESEDFENAWSSAV